jgi:phospholipid/cholesterol/gamma-HCH transport system substrate-binding protein
MTGLPWIGVKFGAFVVSSLALLLLLVNTMNNGLGEDSRTFHAQFTNVSGLRVGDDVKVAGVRVGRVQSIEVSDGGARVGFQLVDEQPLLDTTDVVMRYQNLLGQRYLALVPHGRTGRELEAGDTVPVGRTSPGFDLTELLNGFRPLFEVLKPADVNQLATSMVQVLQGEGGTVESLLQQTTRLTNFVADRDQVIGSVLTNLTPVLQNLAGQDTQLSSTVKELRLLMTGLAKDRKAIGASIDGVGRLVGSTSDLLQDARGPAVAAVRQFVTVSDMLARSRHRLVHAVKALGRTFEGLGRTTSYENALNVYVCSFTAIVGTVPVNTAPHGGKFSQVCR